jgi:hypothetical protein
VLFGDNAYLNFHYMMMLYSNVSSGSKDDFIFFHAQLRICVECAFGMLVFCWGILRAAIPMNIYLANMIALIHALAKLHNFCINKENDNKDLCEHTVPEILQNDEDHMTLQEEGYITININEIGASGHSD